MVAQLRQRTDRPGQWDVVELGEDGAPQVRIVDTPEAARLQREAGATITDGAAWGKTASSRPVMRQRADNPGQWDTAGMGPDGRARVGVVDSARAAEMQRLGSPIVGGEEWGSAAMQGLTPETGQLRPSSPQVEATMGAPRVVSRTPQAAPSRPPMAALDVAPREAPGIPEAVRRRVLGLDSAPEEAMASTAVAGDVAPRPAALTDSATAQRPGGDADFAAAQDDSRQRLLAAQIGRAGGMVNEAISGARYDRGAYDGLEGQARSPVTELLARREADRKARLADPASEESRRFQAAVARAMPGVYSPEEVEQMAAEDQDMLFRAGEMRSRLEERRATRDLQQQQREDERAFRAEQSQLNRQAQADARQGAAADRALRRAEMLSRQQQTEAEKRDDKVATQTQALGKQFLDSGAPNFYNQMGTVERIMQANPNDLPGFGQLAGRMPDMLTSKEGVQLRQAVGQMLAEYRKGITGAGMSDAEREEYNRITGLVSSGDEASVREGVKALKASMDSRVQAMAGGFRPEAVEAYGQRVPTFAAATRPSAPPRVPAVPGPVDAQPTAAPPGDTVAMIDPQGRRRMVPRARVQAALAAGGRLADGQ